MIFKTFQGAVSDFFTFQNLCSEPFVWVENFIFDTLGAAQKPRKRRTNSNIRVAMTWEANYIQHSRHQQSKATTTTTWQPTKKKKQTTTTQDQAVQKTMRKRVDRDKLSAITRQKISNAIMQTKKQKRKRKQKQQKHESTKLGGQHICIYMGDGAKD